MTFSYLRVTKHDMDTASPHFLCLLHYKKGVRTEAEQMVVWRQPCKTLERERSPGRQAGSSKDPVRIDLESSRNGKKAYLVGLWFEVSGRECSQGAGWGITK